jgi:hypothetical protein
MTWRGVFIFAVVALGCCLVGAVIGRLTTRGRAQELYFPATHLPATRRQAVVYLDVVIAWHSYLRAVRTLVYPEEGPPANESRDLASVLHSRAQLEAVGSRAVQDLHDQVLESAVTLIDLLRSLTTSPLPDRVDQYTQRTSLRLTFSVINDRIISLERQMLHELGDLPSVPESEVEITGRAVAAHGPRPGSLALP